MSTDVFKIVGVFSEQAALNDPVRYAVYWQAIEQGYDHPAAMAFFKLNRYGGNA